MGSSKAIPKAEQFTDLVYKLRQDAIARGDFRAYRAARELRDTLEVAPALATSPDVLHTLQAILDERGEATRH